MNAERVLRRFRRRRDEESFRGLYRLHTPMLLALARRMAGNPSDAEDLVQETWIRCVERLDQFEGRSKFSSWLVGILLNLFREFTRRHNKSPVLLDDAPDGSHAEAAYGAPGAQPATIDVERALFHLPLGYREVVVLHDVNGYTHQEIAELLQIAPGTSKSQLHRGRARLRELLAERAPNV